MTDREIKLELAKVAIANGSSIDTAKLFYQWIIENVEQISPTKYDSEPIEVFALKTRNKGIVKRCKENGILTVGDLLRCGANKLSKARNVGRTTINMIDDTLEKYYNIKDWYTT